MRLGERGEESGTDCEVDLDRPLSLAIETRFTGEGPDCFGAPRASARPLAVPGFTGSVGAGGSCNCSTLTLTPHCNGTHTECAGHLTAGALDAIRVVPAGLIPALLLSVAPDDAAGEDGGIVTPALLQSAWQRTSRPDAPPRALVVRTLPNDETKRRRGYRGGTAPYLAAEAAEWLIECGIEHLVVDLPSIDPMADAGRLAAHRVFFGLPPGSVDLALAARAHCTITELAYVPDVAADGGYLLQLQVPALAGDAVPSRPLLYPLQRAQGPLRAWQASGVLSP